MTAVVGSGKRSMSLSLICWKPLMLEPSKPTPSVKVEVSTIRIGTLKCCQVPGTSVNLKSTIRAPFSWARRNTSSGVLVIRSLHPLLWSGAYLAFRLDMRYKMHNRVFLSLNIVQFLFLENGGSSEI